MSEDDLNDEIVLEELEDDELVLQMLADNGQIAFKYDVNNPNGSVGNIAGVYSKNYRILGVMPHPERRVDYRTGGDDGARLFKSVCQGLAG